LQVFAHPATDLPADVSAAPTKLEPPSPFAGAFFVRHTTLRPKKVKKYLDLGKLLGYSPNMVYCGRH
jgi:hypothetical protein